MIKPPGAMDIPDIRLPMEFIITGVLLFVASQGMVLFATDQLAAGIPQTPFVLAAVHLLILGFGVMVTIGAVYQLAPVALQTKIYSTRLGHWQYAFFLIGTLGLWWSFFDFNALRLIIFAAITVFSVILFEYNLWKTIRGVKKRSY